MIERRMSRGRPVRAKHFQPGATPQVGARIHARQPCQGETEFGLWPMGVSFSAAFLLRPYRALVFVWRRDLGRCPRLVCYALTGLGFQLSVMIECCMPCDRPERAKHFQPGATPQVLGTRPATKPCRGETTVGCFIQFNQFHTCFSSNSIL